MAKTKWLQITSGRGPAECCWVVYQLTNFIKKEAEKYDLKLEILEIVKGDYPKTFKSALLALEGNRSDEFLKNWQGSVQWIGESTFRPSHKRKNWFVGVNCFSPPDKIPFSEKDLKIETMRASGPDGQHVNKSDTAVRITHLPSKVSVTAHEERSQHLNKKLALSRIIKLFAKQENINKEAAIQDQWESHNELERGNPVRVFKGVKFKEK